MEHLDPTPDTPSSQQIELVLERVDALPTLSPIAARLLSLTSSDRADLNEIAVLIESDPSLTAKILGLVRRADKGLGDRITTVKRAILMLGLEAVQAAVLSVDVYDLLERAGNESDMRLAEQGEAPRSLFDRAGFWRHSIGVACCAERLAQLHPELRLKPEEAFVAGLVHDLGKIVLDVILPRAYGRVIELAERRGSCAASVERAILGMDHHLAGKRIAAHWQLATPLQEVLWLHSQPIEALPDTPSRTLVALVGVAKLICRHLHVGWSGDFDPPGDVDTAARAIGVLPGRIDTTIKTLHEAVADRCATLGVGEQTSPELLIQSVLAANRRLGRLSATLERKTHQTEAMGRTLGAIQSFLAQVQPSAGVTETLGAVVRSARATLGKGFSGAIYQEVSGGPCVVYQFAADGTVEHSARVQANEALGVDSLRRVLAQDDTSISAVGLLPWLGEYLAQADSLASIRLVPLCQSGDRDAPAAALLCEMHSPLPARVVEALTVCWASSVVAAAQHARAQRLGEGLVEANRALRDAQERLTQAESLTRLGETTAGAAHEMNNPLTVISGRAQLLVRRLSAGPDREAAALIVEAAEDLTELVTSLNLLAHTPQLHLETLEVQRVCERARELALERTAARGEVAVDASAHDLRVVGDRELLARALAELITNALEASSGGNVRIGAETDPLDGRLVLRVEDQGAGMSQRAHKHAFDPFFSDKPAGRQRGLGLTRARRIAQLHGGEVRLSPNPQGGTIATIALAGVEQDRQWIAA